MLLAIAIILLILWGIGLAVHVFGAAINIVLILAVVLAIAHFFRGRGNPSTMP